MKIDIRNAFRKSLLSFEVNRFRFNSLRLFIAGFVSLAAVVGFFIYLNSYIVLSFLILPIGVFWKSYDFYKKSKSAEVGLREMHNGEISDEIKKFSAKGFKKGL